MAYTAKDIQMSNQNVLFSSLVKNKENMGATGTNPSRDTGTIQAKFKRKSRPLAILLKVKKGVLESTVVKDLLDFTNKTNIKNFVKGPNGHYEITFATDSILEGYIIKHKQNPNYEFIRRCERPNITITLHWVNSTIIDEEIIFKINQFAKVTSKVRTKLHVDVNCPSGRKTVLVCRKTLNPETFPNFLLFDNTAILITYEGQLNRCYACGEKGHMRRNCQRKATDAPAVMEKKNHASTSLETEKIEKAVKDPDSFSTTTQVGMGPSNPCDLNISKIVEVNEKSFPHLPSKKNTAANMFSNCTGNLPASKKALNNAYENKALNNPDFNEPTLTPTHTVEITMDGEDKNSLQTPNANDVYLINQNDLASTSATENHNISSDSSTVQEVLLHDKKSWSVDVLRLDTEPGIERLKSDVDIDSLDGNYEEYNRNPESTSLIENDVFSKNTGTGICTFQPPNTPKKRLKQSSSEGETITKTPRKKLNTGAITANTSVVPVPKKKNRKKNN